MEFDHHFIHAFIWILILLGTPFAILIYRKISDREQAEIDARILSSPRRQPEAPLLDPSRTQPSIPSPSTATESAGTDTLDYEHLWPAPPWEEMVGHLTSSAESMEFCLLSRWCVDDEEAHDEEFHILMESTFSRAWKDSIEKLDSVLGAPDLILDADSEEEMIAPYGPSEEAQWKRPGRTVFLSWCHEDRECPYLLVFGSETDSVHGQIPTNSVM